MVWPTFSKVVRVAGREDNWLAGYLESQGTHPVSLGEVEGYVVLFVNPGWDHQTFKRSMATRGVPS